MPVSAWLRAIMAAQPSSTASGPITAHPASTATTATSTHHSRSRCRSHRRRGAVGRGNNHSAAAAAISCTPIRAFFSGPGDVVKESPTSRRTCIPVASAASRSVRNPNTSGTGWPGSSIVRPESASRTDIPAGPAATCTSHATSWRATGKCTLRPSAATLIPVRSPPTVRPAGPVPVLSAMTRTADAVAARRAAQGIVACRCSGR
ncbi:Uncharacterised protein [Mycobacteroides abscessus subsp. abscessus]|nr:Uncharacterised protein [Mycobacteroides abscessus subsp. abscessus]